MDNLNCKISGKLKQILQCSKLHKKDSHKPAHLQLWKGWGARIIQSGKGKNRQKRQAEEEVACRAGSGSSPQACAVQGGLHKQLVQAAPAPTSSKPTEKSVHTAPKSWLPLWDPPADAPTAQGEELVTTPCSSPEMALLLSQLCLSLKVWRLCFLRKYFFLLNICMKVQCG